MTAAGADSFHPEVRTIASLTEAAETCHGCDLFRDADQTVFGAGTPSSRLVLVGEQPGDQEDRAGRPFVGPAGRVPTKALQAADVDHDTLYVTNAVKHFKFVRAERGQRRIHKTPSRTEVVACRPWLLAELEAIDPSVVVLLGATAAKSLLGNDFRLTAHRQEILSPSSDVGWSHSDVKLLATIHPSSILRGPPEDRGTAFDGLVADLRLAADLVGD